MPGDPLLRPYYDHDTFNAGYLVIFKPGVGLIDTATNKPIIASFGQSLGNSLAGKGIGIHTHRPNGSTAAIASGGDKNYVYDLEFLEYFDFSNLLELLKNLFWNFFKNYCKVVVSQPLEIVRLVLQVGYFDFSQAPKPKEVKKHRRLAESLESSNNSLPELESSSEGEEEIDFFQLTRDVSSPQKSTSLSSSKTTSRPSKIQPISRHTVDIMTAIASKDGPFALFRGVNASFIHHTLAHTIEAWITGFLSPFLGIPDPFFLDLTHLTEPAKSLWLSVLACVLAGVVLMPLDLIKVRLMLTQFNRGVPQSESTSSSSSPSPPVHEETQPIVNTRSVRESIRNYPVKYLLHPPSTITLLTVLHQFSTTVFRKASPYILFIRYNVDAYSAPNWYTMANLILLIAELFIKLPMENLLRKEQVRFLLKPKSPVEDRYRVVTIDNPDEDLIVNFNSWDAAHANAESSGKLSYWQRFKLLGLFKGWRVGVLNVIGFWGYNILRSSEVLTEEKL